MTTALLALLAAAATAVIAVWQARRARERREALFTFATSRGWAFTVSDPSLTERWVGAPFGLGDRRKATNVMRGTEAGRELLAFEYQYDTKDSDGDRTTHHYAVVVLGMRAYLPTVEVSPSNVLDRIGSATGIAQDIELESEDFNRRFRVSAYDAKFASDVLSPRTMQLLLARPPVAFRIQATDLVSWTSGGLTIVDLLARAGTLAAVLDGVPEFVWKDHGAGGGLTAAPPPWSLD